MSNAVCDFGAFMAAFGSDISSECCRKLVRRRSEDLGEYIYIIVYLCGVCRVNPSSMFHFSTMCTDGKSRWRQGLLYSVRYKEIIKSRPTITNICMYMYIRPTYDLLGRLWERYSVLFVTEPFISHSPPWFF